MPLGGSFKLVTLAPRTVSEMTQLLKETQKKSLSGQSTVQAVMTEISKKKCWFVGLDHFLIQRIVFPTGCMEKFVVND